MSRPSPNLSNPNLMLVSDARASVLRDCGFVQIGEAPQNKFKLSVAAALHLSAERSQTGTRLTFQPRRRCRFARHLPLTGANAGGFIDS
jgi:hypothetical protein